MIPIRPLGGLKKREREEIIRRPSVLTRPVMEAAKKILKQVREEGDDALRRLTKKFDKADVESLAIPESEIDASERRVPAQARMNLRSAYDTVLRYHREGVLKAFRIEPLKGIELGRLVVPYETAGLYVPGGRAAYPTSVIMAAAPANVAGVPNLVVCTPPDAEGRVRDEILYAAKLSGVRKVFLVGGAQAVAAMAYGTESVPRCGIIVGPGNAYVTAAKKLVQDEVAIDFLAGPSEILILSDGGTSASFIAADLIAQAEHDPEARSVLVTTSESQAKEVVGELEAQAPAQARVETIRAALSKHGIILVAESMEQAMNFANEYGAEHLVLSCRHAVPFLKHIRHAGAVFVGEHSPVATGDYCVGPNHILPTLGDARIRSGLTANTFLKLISYEMLSPDGLRRVAPMAGVLARLEGLGAHERSIEIRMEK